MSGALTVAGAFTGGVKTFFSVWQLCILQFSPFYAAFLLGVWSLARTGKGPYGAMAIALIGLAAGFSVMFALLSSPGVALGVELLRGIKALRFAAGVFIIATGLLLIFMAAFVKAPSGALVPAVLSPLVGASFAVAYSPCIPPVLSSILGYASEAGHAGRGFALLSFYAAGVCLAASISAAAVMGLARAVWGKAGRPVRPVAVSAAIFMLIGVMMVLGWMAAYKRFLVNLI